MFSGHQGTSAAQGPSGTLLIWKGARGSLTFEVSTGLAPTAHKDHLGD